MTSPALVRAVRADAKLTQAQLAERLGTTQPVVARMERADANTTIATLERALAAAGYELELRALPRRHTAVDTSQLAERLRWTPEERLRAHTAAQRNLDALLGSARRTGSGDA